MRGVPFVSLDAEYGRWSGTIRLIRVRVRTLVWYHSSHWMQSEGCTIRSGTFAGLSEGCTIRLIRCRVRGVPFVWSGTIRMQSEGCTDSWSGTDAGQSEGCTLIRCMVYVSDADEGWSGTDAGLIRC